jgi:Multiubiquitin
MEVPMTETPLLDELDPAHHHDHELAKHTVTVHVNERPVRLPSRRVTGLEVKEQAISQGVPIQLDFILVEELEGGRTRTIGDGDQVHVTDRTRFLANDGDDNS